MNDALKEANDAKLYHKEEKGKVLDLQVLIDNTIIELSTLKSFAHLNMEILGEEHDEALNATKDNGTTKTIEELEELRQTMDDKKRDVMDIGEQQDMLMKTN